MATITTAIIRSILFSPMIGPKFVFFVPQSNPGFLTPFPFLLPLFSNFRLFSRSIEFVFCCFFSCPTYCASLSPLPFLPRPVIHRNSRNHTLHQIHSSLQEVSAHQSFCSYGCSTFIHLSLLFRHNSIARLSKQLVHRFHPVSFSFVIIPVCFIALRRHFLSCLMIIADFVWNLASVSLDFFVLILHHSEYRRTAFGRSFLLPMGSFNRLNLFLFMDFARVLYGLSVDFELCGDLQREHLFWFPFNCNISLCLSSLSSAFALLSVFLRLSSSSLDFFSVI